MTRFSPTAISILTILNNINELIVQSSDRQGAKDVMRALNVYAKNKRFHLPEEKINSFYEILLDAKPFTITSLLHNIASDIIMAERKK